MIGAVDECGSLQALVVTDDEEVRAWGEGTVDEYLDRAEPIDPEDSGARAPLADDAS